VTELAICPSIQIVAFRFKKKKGFFCKGEERKKYMRLVKHNPI